MNELNLKENGNGNSVLPVKTDSVVTSRSRLLTRLLLSLVILMCGVVIGVLVTLSFIRYSVTNFQFRPEIATERAMARFNSKYDLTEEQQARIRKIVRDHFDTLEEIGQEVHPKVRALTDEFSEKVAAELNEQQRADWRKRFKYLRDNFLPHEPFRQPKP